MVRMLQHAVAITCLVGDRDRHAPRARDTVKARVPNKTTQKLTTTNKTNKKSTENDPCTLPPPPPPQRA